MNYRDLVLRLSNVGVATPDVDLRIILEDIAGLKPVDWVGREVVLSRALTTSLPDLFGQSMDPPSKSGDDAKTLIIDSVVTDKIISIIDRRAKGEPLGRILGYRDFWKSRFYLSPDTLEPRPDTETLIEAVLNDAKTPKTILDIGTGTGCILLSLLQEYPHAIGTGIDLALGACDTARANAERLRLSDRVTFLNGSWFEPIPDGTRFDVIVSNPPYIPTDTIRNLDENVKNYDPILALDGGEDGLTPYKILLPSVKNYLADGGALYVECGIGQSADIIRIAEDVGATLIRVFRDLGGVERVVKIAFGDN